MVRRQETPGLLFVLLRRHILLRRFICWQKELMTYELLRKVLNK